MSELGQLLLSTPLADVFTAGEANELADSGKQRKVKNGEVVFKAGDPGATLYIVARGSLQVVLGQEPAATVVATVSPGQLVGELEVMTRSLRVATLVATEETLLIELAAAQLEKLLAANRPAATKLVLTIARILARRLAAVNQRIVERQAAAAPVEDGEPVEIGDADAEPIEPSDLDVLDKLWS